MRIPTIHTRIGIVLLTFGVCLATGTARPADETPAQDETVALDFRNDVRPFLKKYCLDCHDALIEEAGVNLEQYQTASAVTEDRKMWEKVFDMLESGKMPPADHEPHPSKEERRRLVKWLEKQLFHVDCEKVDNPGHVTIRRLNRAEYNNTIRDLVGVDFEPARNFPSDDVGYGFDNIGSVLTLPTLLMEKYLDAAEQVADKAIVTDPLQETAQRVEAAEFENTNGHPAGGGFFRLTSTGAVYQKFEFSKTGEYLLRAEAAADQAGPEPAKMEFRLDGEKVKVFEVEGERKPKVYETKLKIEKGNRKFAAAFINDYYKPDADDPKLRGDRNLGVRFLEVRGPLNVPPELPETHERIVFTRPDNPEDEKQVRIAAQKVLGRFMKRAFRRPVNNAEVEKYVDLAVIGTHKGGSFEHGIQVALQGVLVSPHFLFRIEDDPDDPQGVHRLDNYEIASRLSYFLWSSMPDEELFRLAEEGRLQDEKVVRKQALRMLQDRKAQALVDNFAAQWLNLGLLDDMRPDPEQFPEFSEKLRADMRQETKLFFENVMREDRSILDFLDANFTFLNERLAKLYGIDGVKGEKFRRVDLKEKPRKGVLTQASVLTLTSNPTRTSPVKRGKWILKNILGTPPPEPPPNVPDIEEAKKAAPDASFREQLELHRDHPGCASCHAKMDPLGFGFQNFDAIGRWREKNGEFPVDASGTLPGGETFQGPLELIKILKQRKDEFCRSFVKKMLTYALGRGLDYYDKCAVDEIVKSLPEKGYRFSAVVTGIVTSDPFLKRGSEEANNE